MAGAPRAAARLAGSAVVWAAGTSAVTAGVSSLGRTLCLPPYWPREFVLRCRPGGMGPALARLPLDALLTTVLMFVPALLLGAGVHLLVRGAMSLERPGITRVVGVGAGAGSWVWLAGRMETSYLDFILGWYAIGAGAIVGGVVGGWYMGRAETEFGTRNDGDTR